MASRRGLTVTLLVVCALAGSTPAYADDGFRLGIQGWYIPSGEVLDVAGSGGASSFRVQFDWAAIEPSRRLMNWTQYDALMEASARADLRVLPVLIGTPPYLSPTHLGPPVTSARRVGWASFVRAVALRYGRDGTFWSTHPELTPKPPTHYQVWNEPNLDAYWRRAPDAGQYVRLLALSRREIRAADPKALIVTAGLAESRRGRHVLEYLADLYRQPGSRRTFDVLAVHAYARTSASAVDTIERVRALAVARGDGRTPLWVTELGWAAVGPASPFTVTPARQAVLLRETFATLRARRVELRLGAIFWFNLQDRRLREDERDWFGPHTGLFNVNGDPRPAWDAFRGLTGAAPTAGLPAAPISGR